MNKSEKLIKLIEDSSSKDSYTAFVKLAWDKTLKKTCDTKAECQDWINKMDKKYPGDQLVAAWINPTSVGAGTHIKVPNTGPIKVGDLVKVVDGSGIDSGKEGKVTLIKDSRLGKMADVKQENGNVISMYTKRLIHVK